MSSKKKRIVVGSIAVLLAGHGASADGGPESATSACLGSLPPEISAPAGNGLAFELRAEGTQIYSCAASPGGTPAWTLKAPEATLTDARGAPAGTHGAGPRWTAPDGSAVVGAKVAAATPDPASVPWLLLAAASHEGGGRMSGVTFVQRIRTSGGLAPPEGCSAATAGAEIRVPYRALYCFYGREAGRAGGADGAPARSHGPREP